jgi:hypothetical protein
VGKKRDDEEEDAEHICDCVLGFFWVRRDLGFRDIGIMVVVLLGEIGHEREREREREREVWVGNARCMMFMNYNRSC